MLCGGTEEKEPGASAAAGVPPVSAGGHVRTDGRDVFPLCDLLLRRRRGAGGVHPAADGDGDGRRTGGGRQVAVGAGRGAHQERRGDAGEQRDGVLCVSGAGDGGLAAYRHPQLRHTGRRRYGVVGVGRGRRVAAAARRDGQRRVLSDRTGQHAVLRGGAQGQRTHHGQRRCDGQPPAGTGGHGAAHRHTGSRRAVSGTGRRHGQYDPGRGGLERGARRVMRQQGDARWIAEAMKSREAGGWYRCC